MKQDIYDWQFIGTDMCLSYVTFYCVSQYGDYYVNSLYVGEKWLKVTERMLVFVSLLLCRHIADFCSLRSMCAVM